MVDTSIERTAVDALQAKSSSIAAGYAIGSRTYQERTTQLAAHMTASGRQTPLVHLGYALRTAVIASAVERFILHHQDRPTQLVILGAGLDVLGLSVLMEHCSVVEVIEVDTEDNSQRKRQALMDLGWITSDDNIQAAIWIGRPKDCPDQCYRSLAIDLTIASSLETLELDPQRPTLIISELVLAYLGETAVERVLDWCARHVGKDGCLVALEPLGQCSSSTTDAENVENGYQAMYLAQFQAILERGQSKAASFAPLGEDCQALERRLSGQGFSRVHAITVGQAATADKPWRTKELFDEHAALTLHLRSYSVVFGFGIESSKLFRRHLCPFVTNCPPIQRPIAAGDMVWITSLEREHEHGIRRLFTDAYEPFYDEYPTLRKMCYGALEKDLLPTAHAHEDVSSMYRYYHERGGYFLVAINTEHSVLGGVAVRRLELTELHRRGLNRPSFEMYRLVVDPTTRKSGLARTLLTRLEELLAAQAAEYHLIAVTLTILTAANHFYAKHGFQFIEDSPIKELTLRTFIKTVERPK